MILKQRFEPLARWESIGFAETAKDGIEKALRTRKGVQVGDLVCVISSEHVSNIEQNIQWLGFAATAGKRIHVLDAPRYRYAECSWIGDYYQNQQKHVLRIIYIALDLIDRRSLVHVFCELAKEVSTHPAIQWADTWSKGDDTHFREIKETFRSFIRTGVGALKREETCVFNLCGIVVSPNNAEDYVSSLISEIRLSFLHETDRHRGVIFNIVTSLIPLNALLLATHAENVRLSNQLKEMSKLKNRR